MKNDQHDELVSGVARIFFGGGEAPARPLKGYHAPPAGGPGAKAPRTVAKFHFFKRFKVLENESIFQKYQHFLYETFRKIEHIF